MQNAVVEEVFSRLGNMSLNDEQRRLADMRATAISIAKGKDEMLEREVRLRKQAEEKNRQMEEKNRQMEEKNKQMEIERNMFMQKYIQSMINMGKSKDEVIKELSIDENTYQDIMK